MNLTYLSLLANHLWQSTLFAAVAGLLILALRNNYARVRYWVWLAASLKFLIPLSMLVAMGSLIRWQTAPKIAPSSLSVAMDEISQPFTAPAVSSPLLVTVPPAASHLPVVLLDIWACGFLGISCSWWIRWRRILATVRSGSAMRLAIPIPARSTPALLEPGIFGVFRPVLLLPEGIFKRLTSTQLQAVLAHELCHIRYRDNLTAAIHMFVETVFWFHPLVWWIGKRMMEERERACDEEVLRLGSEPRVYAEGILNVCKHYVESPLVCVSGVTGSNLKRRIEAIMKNRISHDLGFGSKLLLAGAALVAVAGPLAVGIMDAPALRGQSGTVAAPKYEVAAIRPAKEDGEVGFDTEKGRFTAHNVTVKALVSRAYDLDKGLISGGPKWVNSDTYDIDAKFPDGLAQPTSEQGRLMLQSLLADRFQLVIHREPGEVSGYALVVAKNGPKMERADPDLKGIKIRSSRDGNLIAQNVTMEAFAKGMNHFVGSPVVDRTGLSGYFKFELDWAPEQPVSNPEPSSDDRPSIFTALQERLGLRLESAKIPISSVVIDHAERPSAN